MLSRTTQTRKLGYIGGMWKWPHRAEISVHPVECVVQASEQRPTLTPDFRENAETKISWPVIPDYFLAQRHGLDGEARPERRGGAGQHVSCAAILVILYAESSVALGGLLWWAPPCTSPPHHISPRPRSSAQVHRDWCVIASQRLSAGVMVCSSTVASKLTTQSISRVRF